MTLPDILSGLYAFLALILPLPTAMGGAGTPRKVPEPVSRLESPGLKEASGLDESASVPGRFWTHNDSGNPAELFAIDAKGKSLGNPLPVDGAENKDWEAVVVDGKGQLWIADVGNNANTRRDLALHRIKEPGAELPERVTVEQTIRFQYPDQQAYPPEKSNFDCEAVFFRNGMFYILTKHRADRDTTLYRLDPEKDERVQPLELLQRIQGVGQVTDADLHPDGDRLAVLTFSGVWVFDLEGGEETRLGARPLYLRVEHWAMRQTEGVAWLNEETLMIHNEQRDVFHLPVSEKAGFRKVSVDRN